MRVRYKILALGLLALALAFWLWPHGHQPLGPAKTPIATTAKTVTATVPSAAVAATNRPIAENTGKISTNTTDRLKYRLANTTLTFKQLSGDRHALLLENALIDTDSKTALKIPAHLKAKGEPGAYLVQSRGVISPALRSAIGGAGGMIVSYIPNNAYLVQISSAGAGVLAGNSLVQAVLPYEPYYKIQSTLLDAAVKQQVLPPNVYLTLGLYNSGSESTLTEIEKAGARILSVDPHGAFGPVIRVAPPADWTSLAAIPNVFLMEPAYLRKAANDQDRVAVGVATDTVTLTNYLNLTGSNVLVELNDTGVDPGHPDFGVATNGSFQSRVIGWFDTGSTNDTLGHGTHVAGILAGNGAKSSTINTSTNLPSGSVTNANFRGKAPSATLYSFGFLSTNDASFSISDTELQEVPARTNAFISNNSWGNVGDFDYDLSAASYDAAVRDAIPETTGPQPMIFVFAAGNDGGGDDNGQGGTADTIISPGTAKDVITVGALEQLRNITNIVTALDGSSNAIWAAETQSGSLVAGFSARGNVGIQTEGQFGRFKPDVVAPGVFTVSTRSTMWDQMAYFNPTNYHTAFFANQEVTTDSVVEATIQIPQNAVGVQILVSPSFLSPVPFPTNMPIFVSTNGFPDPTDPTTYDFVTSNNAVNIPPDGGAGYLQSALNGAITFAIADPTNVPVQFNLFYEVITTNDNGNELTILSNLDNTLAPYYRYESGTSMATPAVSGTLALMEDLFTNTLHAPRPSPALMKAMLINGARLTDGYQFSVTNTLNLEGWGLVNLPNSIPAVLTNTPGTLTNSPFFYVDESPTNLLATGDSMTYLVSTPGLATQIQPMKLTLAWTDPPGNPAAAIKLVNQLALVVTNLDNHTVYYANNFTSASSQSTVPSQTNDPVQYDNINNVQTIILPPLLSSNYSVTVRGVAVNVNAVTTEETNIVQDFALVISCGDGFNTNGFSITAAPTGLQAATAPNVNFLVATNGIYFDQIVGSDAPWLSTNSIGLGTNFGVGTNALYATNAVYSIGQTNQWHFYVITNTFAITNASFTNAAFITFIPDTLALPREGVNANSDANSTRPEAELDLFVASAPDLNASGLTNLDPNVISNCLFNLNGDGANIGRGGTKFVAYSNSVANQVYFVGVHCQDQTAGQYAFLPIFSAVPFSQLDQNGNQIINGVPVPQTIPDGNNRYPGIGYVVGLALYPMEVRRVITTNTYFHQNFGDLVGSLTHNDTGVILNNHDGLGTVQTSRQFVYDDSGQGDLGTTNIHSDGPGSLNLFKGQEAIGPWIMTEVDNSYTETGFMNSVQMRIEPHRSLRNQFITVQIPGGSWFYDFIDVPVGYTNLTVVGTNVPPVGALPIQMYVNEGNIPTFATTNVALLTNAPSGNVYPGTAQDFFGNQISVGPPLVPDRYFIGLFNPNLTPETVILGAFLTFNQSAIENVDYDSDHGPVPLLDDAVTTDDIFVTNTDIIQEFQVGLRIDHPRISDLSFTLTDPSGNRYLLMENRGGQDTNGCGITVISTNSIPVTATGGAAATTNFINVGVSQGPIGLSWDFFTVPDTMDVYYQGTNIFSTGLVSGAGSTNLNFGPGNSTTLEIVMNANNHPPTTFWTYTLGGITTNIYYLSFTEDTNLTTTPIKLAPTPFISPPSSLVFTDNFDSYVLGTYTAGSAFGPWTVLTNQVDIATTPPANSLPNELALDDGAVQITLPTLAGKKYQLQYEQGTSGTDSGGVATNANWQLVTYDFTATNDNETLTFDATGDPNFTATLTNGVVRSYAAGSFVLIDDLQLIALQDNLFYQAEQSLSPITGQSAYGDWQLEILDNRAGAFDSNSPPLLQSWQLHFEFANTNFTIPPTPLTNTMANTNTIPAGGILWYQIDVPYNAIQATNELLFATGPVNFWYSTNVPPTITNTTDILFAPQVTTFANVLTTNGTPPLVPSTTYYLGVQNTNTTAVTVAVQVNFLLGPTRPTLPVVPNIAMAEGNVDIITNAATDTNAGAVLVYSFPNPEPSWVTIDTIGTITLAPPTNVAPTNATVTTIATDTFTGLSATNSFNVYVFPQLISGQPQTNILSPALVRANGTGVSPGNIYWYLVQVPANALAVTNALLSATAPVNLWYSTNIPPTVGRAGDVKLLTNQISGVVVITSNTIPSLVPNSTYFLGVQNPNSVTVTDVVEITFLLGATPPVLPVIPTQAVQGGQTLTVTNTATDTNAGAVLVYQLVNPPANATIDGKGIISWPTTTDIAPTNVVITTVVKDTYTGLNATNSFTVDVLPGLSNGNPVTNTIPAGSIYWFLVQVPPNALTATNTLLFASPQLNLWYSTNVPPTIINTNDYELLANSTGGTSVLTPGSTPSLVPGGYYFLGVQNTNNTSATFAAEVTFEFGAPVLPAIPDQAIIGGNTLVVTNTALYTNATAVLVYQLITPPSPAGAAIDPNGIITWTTPVVSNLTAYAITTVVTDNTTTLSATNNFNVFVFPPFSSGGPVTNVVAPGAIEWFQVNVPTNAIAATNALLFSTLPVNLWYSVTLPPTITNSTDFEFLTNATSGVAVINSNSTPPMPVGGTYFLGVQNTNTVAITNAISVTFAYAPLPVFILSITPTNINGTNGYLLTWPAATNYQFHLQWTPALAPANWQNFKGVISYTSFVTATNSKFRYFDDGSQSGSFNTMRFYRLQLLNSPTNTPPFFTGSTPPNVIMNFGQTLVVTNAAADYDTPAQTITYSLQTSMGLTNPPVINNKGVIFWTPIMSQTNSTNTITTIVTDNGVPPKSVSNTFTVIVSTNSSAPTISGVSIVTNGVKLAWSAPTNDQFNVQWATNLLPPVSWTIFPNIITSTNSTFIFVDTNKYGVMKFYQLILLP